MRKNRLNQPSFVVPLAGLEGAPGFAKPCTRQGELSAKGTFARVTFGARAGALVAELPARERPSQIALAVLAAQKLREAGHKGVQGRVDMVAWLARRGVPETREGLQELVDQVRSTRARLARVSTRKAVAKAILAGE